MPFPIKRNFRAGMTLNDVEANWLNAVATFVNEFSVTGLKLTKTTTGIVNIMLLTDDSTLEIANDGVTVQIKDDGVTRSKIAPNAVGSTEIASLSIGLGHINDGQVSSAKTVGATNHAVSLPGYTLDVTNGLIVSIT